MALIVFAATIAVIWVLTAGMVGQKAERKGNNNLHWYVFSLFCSLGYAVVSLLPAIVQMCPPEYKQCAHCSNMVKVGEAICPHCKADFTRKEQAEGKAA